MIPFFWRGEYHLFYLPRSPEGRHCWGHIISKNLLDWEELPDAIEPSGDLEAPDAVGCWTGSVIEHDGIFHCFYTGFNPQKPFPQTVCHAVSHDLVHWRKDPQNPVVVPDERWYEGQDWRDPFVFFNPEVDEFWMLVCARDKRVAFERRGCVALSTSKDLQNWQVKEPVWSGSICWATECPDMFRIDSFWYLVYSHGITRYRWTEKLDGIWQTSFPDTFDTEFLAAAKTLFDGKRRILFGWIGTLEGENDFGARQWGGHMALPRELVYKPNGSLSVKLPEEFEIWHAKNSSPLPLKNCKPVCGNWQFSESGAIARTLNGVSVLQCDAPPDFFLSTEIVPQGEASEFGFLLRMQDGKGYKLVLNKSHIALMNWSSWGDVEPRLSRPVTWKEGERLKVQLIVHGSILEIFVSDTTSLTGRIYKTPSGWFGLYAANGEVEFQNVRFAPLRPLD